MTVEFSSRLEDAKKLVARNSVKKYIIDEKVERWVVVGNSREYLVLVDPYWCLCYDFQHGVLNNRITQCKHNLAVQIALKENKYDIIKLSKGEFDFVRPYFLLT